MIDNWWKLDVDIISISRFTSCAFYQVLCGTYYWEFEMSAREIEISKEWEIVEI